jgi:hypothetical protein
MFHSILPVLVILLTAVVAAVAAWKGDDSARIAGIINFLNAVALPLARQAMQTQTGEVLQLAGDFFWAVGLLILVVRYASVWLGLTMMLQAVQFSLHAYYLVNDMQPDLLHHWINNLDEVGISICIAVGVVTAIRRRMEFAREEAELEARRQKVSGAT